MITLKINSYNSDEMLVLFDALNAARCALPECPENGTCFTCKNRKPCTDLDEAIAYLKRKIVAEKPELD